MVGQQFAVLFRDRGHCSFDGPVHLNDPVPEPV